MRLSGNTVLLTGAAGGIGRALAAALLSRGNRVLAVDRDEAGLQAAVAALPGLVVYPCNLGNPEALGDLVAAVIQDHPGLNLLINNAAVHGCYRFTDRPDPRRIADELRSNLLAPMQLTALLLPLLARQREAAVVNVTSGLAFAVKADAAVYCASKAGLHQFTRVLREQLRRTPVRVLELLPPLVDTPMTSGRGAGKISAEALARRFLLGLGRDEEEMSVGSVRGLRLLHRLHPALADWTIERG